MRENFHNRQSCWHKDDAIKFQLAGFLMCIFGSSNQNFDRKYVKFISNFRHKKRNSMPSLHQQHSKVIAIIWLVSVFNERRTRYHFIYIQWNQYTFSLITLFIQCFYTRAAWTSIWCQKHWYPRLFNCNCGLNETHFRCRNWFGVVKILKRKNNIVYCRRQSFVFL